MDAKDAFTRMFQVLKTHGVYAIPQFKRDIEDLIKSDITKFIFDFTKAFSRVSLKDQNKYITEDVNNKNVTILLNAFNEVKGKTKGKNAYKFNIERALKIYESLK